MSQNKVKVEGYPMCCGMFIMSNFYKNLPPERIGKGCGNCRQVCRSCEQDSQTWLYETQEEYIARIKKEIQKPIKDYQNYKSYILATLNEEEEKEIGYLFRDAGFVELLPMTRNPTGTSIITYVYHLLKPKETKSIVKKAVRL